MSKVIEGGYRDVSVRQFMPGKVELRIHSREGSGPQGDQDTHLTPSEARILAYALLAEAERVDSVATRN
jgi:hypothetical protein